MDKKFKPYGYGMVVLCAIPWLLTTFMTATSLQIFLTRLETTSGVPYTTLLNFVTIGNLVCCLTSFMGGTLIEKFGCRRVMVVAGIISAINYALLPSYKGILLLLGIIINQSFGIMFCLLPTGVLMGNWFPRKNSIAMGVCTAANTFASLLLLPLFNNLLAKVDLVATMRIFSIPMLVYFILCIFLIKEKPGDLGLDPDGMPMTDAEREQFVKKDGEKSPWGVLDILKNKSFCRMIIGWGLVSMVMIGFSYVGIPTMTSKGLNLNTAVTIATFAGVVGFFGDTISGWVGDWIGIKKTTVIYVGLEAIGMFMLCFAKDGQTWLIAAGYYAFMLMNGVPNNLMSVNCLQLGGAKNYASTYKIVWGISAIIRALGTTVCSVVLKVAGNYNYALLIFGIMAVLGLIMLYIAGSDYQTPPAKKAKQSA